MGALPIRRASEHAKSNGFTSFLLADFTAIALPVRSALGVSEAKVSSVDPDNLAWGLASAVGVASRSSVDAGASTVVTEGVAVDVEAFPGFSARMIGQINRWAGIDSDWDAAAESNGVSVSDSAATGSRAAQRLNEHLTSNNTIAAGEGCERSQNSSSPVDGVEGDASGFIEVPHSLGGIHVLVAQTSKGVLAITVHIEDDGGVGMSAADFDFSGRENHIGSEMENVNFLVAASEEHSSSAIVLNVVSSWVRDAVDLGEIPEELGDLGNVDWGSLAHTTSRCGVDGARNASAIGNRAGDNSGRTSDGEVTSSDEGRLEFVGSSDVSAGGTGAAIASERGQGGVEVAANVHAVEGDISSGHNTSFKVRRSPVDVFKSKDAKASSISQRIFASDNFVDDADEEALLSANNAQTVLILDGNADDFAGFSSGGPAEHSGGWVGSLLGFHGSTGGHDGLQNAEHVVAVGVFGEDGDHEFLADQGVDLGTLHWGGGRDEHWVGIGHAGAVQGAGSAVRR